MIFASNVGAGEPVLLVHGALVADWFAPPMVEPTLTGRFRLIDHHRVGYGGSTHVVALMSIADQAAHCGALLEHLGQDFLRVACAVRDGKSPASISGTTNRCALLRGLKR